MGYAVKVALAGRVPEVISLDRQRTMSGGKAVAACDMIYLFDSATSGGGSVRAEPRGTAVDAAGWRGAAGAFA